MIASRRKEKCDKLVKDIHAKGYKMDIQTAEVDADDVEQLKALFNSYKPELVINLLCLTRISPSWMPVWLAVATIWIPLTMSQRTRLTSSTHGSGI